MDLLIEFDSFLLRSLFAGMAVALVAGVLGCFVVWRRMAYFGDSLAHSALLGVALGLLWGIDINLSTLLLCSLFAILLVWLQQRRLLATDTLLGIMAHGALSLGMVAISLLNKPSFDINRYLFGDILTVSSNDLLWIVVGGAAVLATLALCWSSLVLMTLHEDLAKAESVNILLMQILLMTMMTVVVAISIRVVGILLITSLLIIPAATARLLANSPERMAIISALLGMVSVILGLLFSLWLDTPTGPSIVASATLLFALIAPVLLRKH
jgi:zinc transport system permease protein